MRHSGLARCSVIVCLLLVLTALATPIARADCPLYRLPTNRFGVDVSPNYGRITDFDAAALHISWYSDWWSARTPLRPGGVGYVQDIWIDAYTGEVRWQVEGGSTWEVLGQLVDANPGMLWLIGNEPECPNWPGGGRMTWQQYGDIYHDMYTFIKGRDPTAQIAIGAIVQPTALRLKWLNNLLDYYQATYGVPMPVDVWNIHVLILREQVGSWGAGIPVGLTETEGLLIEPQDNYNINLFRQFVIDFRNWMKSKGFRDKPLIITEFGVLMPPGWGATPDVVNAFMNACFDFLLTATNAETGYPADSNRLVQRWLWCSLNDSPDNFNGALFVCQGDQSPCQPDTFPGTLTEHGLNFMNYTNALLTGTASINGTVSLEGRPAAPHASYVTTAILTLLEVGCPQPDIRSVKTNEYGAFTLSKVQPATYDIVIKGYNTLATRKYNVVLSAGTTSVSLGPLRSGDANNDNRVTEADFSILAAAYRTVSGDGAYDHRADFNGDGQVNLRDFSLLANHYSQVGDPSW